MARAVRWPEEETGNEAQAGGRKVCSVSYVTRVTSDTCR
jgi:hypothetical protein